MQQHGATEQAAEKLLSMDFLLSMQKQNQEVLVCCEKHGEFTRNELIELTGGGNLEQCPHCVREKREGNMLAVRKEFALQHFRTKSGVPPRFQTSTFANYQAQNQKANKLLQVLGRYAKNFTQHKKTGTSLIFCGKTGTGKTHLACALLQKLAEEHAVLGTYSVAYSAIQAIRASYKSPSLTEQQALQEFLQPELLVLDEIGVQYGTDSEKVLLFSIINGRYEMLKPSIIISNLSLQELIPYLGDRNYDRLRDDGGAVLTFDWESWRTKPKGAAQWS